MPTVIEMYKELQTIQKKQIDQILQDIFELGYKYNDAKTYDWSDKRIELMDRLKQKKLDLAKCLEMLSFE